ncbi:S9 family peptidase [Cupriavidus sp. AU9028]|uniref:S9 family peptidase n=1 Tax=Cupriavidus sp. AU9028 TaxID=2871157 RepID=UPI001C96ED20|nr:S9 family peptidase [Cupriavidus sp. AU9028]MBY4899065.1 S9 family peptidase [Cupriavidus sp. AU9028]
MATPFEVEDLFQYQRIMSMECSPASEMVACTVETVNKESDSYGCAIWLYPTRPGEQPPRQLTAGTALDTAPMWSADGERIAFLSSRSGGAPQPFVIRHDGGEARQLSFFAMGAVSVSWSPSGDRLLVTANVPIEEDDYQGQSGPLEDGGPEVVWQLPYKSDNGGYALRQRSHLFALDLASGNTTQLTRGSFNVEQAQWAPDGQSIVYARTRSARAAHRSDIWTMRADGFAPRQLTDKIGTGSAPSVSSDGRWLACLGGADEGDARLRLWLIDRQDDSVRRLCPSLELAPECMLRWSDDSRSLYLISARRGLQEVGRVSVPDGEYSKVAGELEHVRGLARSASRLVYLAESLSSPNQLYSCDLDGGNGAQITALNPWWNERTLPEVSLRQFDVPDGQGGTEQIEGWLMRPPDATGPGPLLVNAHGGPSSYTLLAFTSHVYWHVLCSRGWSILSLNAVGSSSYEDSFAERLRGHWGELDLPQHLAAIETLRNEKLTDERIAIAGKSYGGYLASWAIGNSDWFRAAVISAPIINLEAHYGNSDSGYYSDPYEMLGEPTEQRDTYRRLSPLPYLPSARTPTLILQGKDDQRCCIGQSEELFVAMMRNSTVPVEMVLYPGGNHHFYESGLPSFRRDVNSRLIRWLERYIAEPVEQAQG